MLIEAYQQLAAAYSTIDISEQRQRLAQIDRRLEELEQHKQRAFAERREVEQRQTRAPDPAESREAAVRAYIGGEDVGLAIDQPNILAARHRDLTAVWGGLRSRLEDEKNDRRRVLTEVRSLLYPGADAFVAAARLDAPRLTMEELLVLYADVHALFAVSGSIAARSLTTDLHSILSRLASTKLVTRRPLSVSSEMSAALAEARDVLEFTGRYVPGPISFPELNPLFPGEGFMSVSAKVP